jgi:hypothetical protein
MAWERACCLPVSTEVAAARRRLGLCAISALRTLRMKRRTRRSLSEQESSQTLSFTPRSTRQNQQQFSAVQDTDAGRSAVAIRQRSAACAALYGRRSTDLTAQPRAALRVVKRRRDLKPSESGDTDFHNPAGGPNRPDIWEQSDRQQLLAANATAPQRRRPTRPAPQALNEQRTSYAMPSFGMKIWTFWNGRSGIINDRLISWRWGYDKLGAGQCGGGGLFLLPGTQSGVGPAATVFWTACGDANTANDKANAQIANRVKSLKRTPPMRRGAS